MGEYEPDGEGIWVNFPREFAVAEFEKRECKREAHCRWCDETIKKGTPMVVGYSWRNRGMNIMFCLYCASRIGDLAHGKA